MKSILLVLICAKRSISTTHAEYKKKKKTFCQHARVDTAGETVLLSAASSCAASYVRMRTTVKHHAAGTVKRTVPYKDFCIFFINWGMATDIKLKDYIYIYMYIVQV
jgi:hypothetical protein